VTTAVLIV